MKRLRMFLIAAALMTAGSALATAQPFDHDHDARRDVRAERRFDRDDVRVRVDHRYAIGERRFLNGYYWTWDGARWYRPDGRVMVYLNF